MTAKEVNTSLGFYDGEKVYGSLPLDGEVNEVFREDEPQSRSSPWLPRWLRTTMDWIRTCFDIRKTLSLYSCTIPEQFV